MFGIRALKALLSVAVLAGLTAQPAWAKDLFVKAGASGDGTQQNPFGDPFEALEKCEANDVIHIAQGRYTGKLESGEWKIPYEGVQLLGGYSADWSSRDPWKYTTQLVWDRKSKNYPKGPRIEATVRGVVLDGLVLDGREQNEYDDPQESGRSQKSLDKSEEMVRLTLPSIVRNCVILNTGREAIVCPVGSTIENNLILNVFQTGVKVNSLPPASPESKVPAVVKNNTIAWSWCDRAPAKGRYSGAAVSMGGPANISNNILVHCDNNALYCTGGLERSSITNNVFFMNLFSNLKLGIDGKDVTVDDKTMDLLDECGFKSVEGNVAANPGLPLDPDWMEGAAKRTAAQHGKVEMDDWNKLRESLGMDLKGTGFKPASGVAPAYALDKALLLITPKNPDIKAGARIKKLEPKFAGPSLAGPSKAYEKKEITAWASDPASVDGKPLEMVVAVSNVTNIAGIPATYKQDDHEGIRLHDADGTVWVTGFYKKGTAVNRLVTEAAGQYNGSGKANRLYVVKGTAYVLNGYPKSGFFIESMVPFEMGAVARERKAGRDWFVRAGATGGNGTKEKPFKDPYQALEKCEAGDTIHVATGEYVGKLRAGHWVVDCPDITMLGGYDKDFTTRDPWKNPVLLYCPADFKGTRGGYTLEGDGDHTGFVLDGFVFDKKTNNQYAANGDLMVMESDKTEHLWLAKPDCVVRNCVFVNGATGAVRLSTAQTVENNIFLNHYKMAVHFERTFKEEVPVQFKHNTLAFAWETRFGSGHGIMADLLVVEADVRMAIDNNIFEFADQHALRINGNPKDIELTNNVFAHNLWADVYRPMDDQVIDNKNFAQLKQLGWKKLEGNVQAIPGLPVDQKWFDTYLNRTAYVPGKVQMDDWNQMREILGQPMIATGGSPGSGLAPAYDWKKALTLFPKNDKVKAGARPVPIAVKFEGVARKEEEHEYADTTWDSAKSVDEWAKLEGKRVAMKVAIKQVDTQYELGDITKEKYAVYQVGGPEGIDSGGLPMRVYVPLGTRTERVFRQAKGYSSGAVAETHILKGIARAPRVLVVEAAERSGD